MKRITILVPAYNESASLPLLVEALENMSNSPFGQGYEWEYLFINDGSKDNTLQVLKELRQKNERVNYIDLSRNYGKENAMLAGFDYASGDAVVVMDADLQHPPQLIPQLVEKWSEGYDDVYAQRRTRGKESWLRRRLTMRYYRLLQKSTRLNVYPNVGDFRLLDRRCVEALKSLRESGRYTKGMFSFIGFRKTGVEFETQDRMAGQSKMSMKNLVNLALEGITQYTVAPLRWSAMIGFVVSVLAFIYMVYVVIKAILFGDPVAGWPTLLTVILLLGGLTLVSLGIIGEYVGKIFIEVKQRPVYFVREYNGDDPNINHPIHK